VRVGLSLVCHQSRGGAVSGWYQTWCAHCALVFQAFGLEPFQAQPGVQLERPCTNCHEHRHITTVAQVFDRAARGGHPLSALSAPVSRWMSTSRAAPHRHLTLNTLPVHMYSDLRVCPLTGCSQCYLYTPDQSSSPEA